MLHEQTRNIARSLTQTSRKTTRKIGLNLHVNLHVNSVETAGIWKKTISLPIKQNSTVFIVFAKSL